MKCGHILLDVLLFTAIEQNDKLVFDASVERYRVSFTPNHWLLGSFRFEHSEPVTIMTIKFQT